MKPYGYVFEGRFYTDLDQLVGKTMSEGNKPEPVYSEAQMQESKTRVYHKELHAQANIQNLTIQPLHNQSYRKGYIAMPETPKP